MENAETRPDVSTRPIRYGILDILAAIVLFGIHFGCLKSLLEHNAPFRDDELKFRMVAAAALCAAFAFGAAYLAFRYATSNKIYEFSLRILTLIVIDAGLIASPFVLGVIIAILFEFPALLLLLIAIIYFWRTNR